MKKQQRVALYGAGKLNDSPLANLPNLGDHLGPVKAPSLRVASRIANRLRAGRPVAGLDQFDHSALILVSVPAESIASTVRELAAAPLDWEQKTVVLFSDTCGCDALEPLASRGAVTGSLAVVPGFSGPWYVLEGGRKVERPMRPLIAHRGARITVIERLERRKYADALERLAATLLPALKDAAESFKEAGLDAPESALMLDTHVTRLMRSYFRSGKSGA